MNNELLELEKRYAHGRQENSFYTDMLEVNETYGSPYFLGNFSDYTYYIDNASQKIMRTELKK